MEIGVAPACRLVGLEDHNVRPGLGLDGHALDSFQAEGGFITDLRSAANTVIGWWDLSTISCQGEISDYDI